MEKIKFVNPTQGIIFREFSKYADLTLHFYFTGDTALSSVYLQHRESEDLDFFSELDFENELVIDFMNKVATKLELPARFTQKYKARIFEFVKDEQLLIKVDFVHQPHKRIEKGKIINNVQVDSLRDIATNKLLTTNQRTDVKDFVDLYFLLQEYTLWDLIYDVEAKFNMELDLILISADFLKVEQFDFLPRMLVPLELSELQNFFKQQSRELAKKFTK